jgi:hypothetical protein
VPPRPAATAHDTESMHGCLQCVGLKSTLVSLTQAWLVLVIMQTPINHSTENARIEPKLQLLSQQRRLPAAALRVTAKLLCHPDCLLLYLSAPLFSLSLICEQHSLVFILKHLPAVLLRCMADAGQSSMPLRSKDAAAVVRALSRSAPVPSPAPPSPPTAAIQSEPADSIPQVTEQLLRRCSAALSGQEGGGGRRSG